MIELNIPNFGNINVCNNGEPCFFVKRKILFLDRVFSEYFESDSMVLKTEKHQILPCRAKILFQNFKKRIKILSTFNLFTNKFLVNQDVIKIVDNPFYIFSKNFSKIYYNQVLIAKVKLKSRIGVGNKGGIGLIVDYESDVESEVIYYSLICYLISCSILNS